MVMHPYLPELNGQDLTDYEDQRGKKLFVAFVDAVRENGSGFVDYYWQWKDDPDRIVPKLSYVEEFKPWQWVIGTGIYVEDVNAAIARVQRYLTYISLAIAAAIALLLLYAARQSLKIEKRRATAEQGLKESNEKYQALVAAATEGIIMTLDGKCAYANKPLHDMLGYEAHELADMILSLLVVNENPGGPASSELHPGPGCHRYTHAGRLNCLPPLSRPGLEPRTVAPSTCCSRRRPSHLPAKKA